MNYQEVIRTALTYTDRLADPELSEQLPDQSWPRLDLALRMVESRVNRNLQTRNQSKRAYIITSIAKEYYGLPVDFAGLRDIEVRASQDATARQTMQYVTPEYMNSIVGRAHKTPYYTIVNNMLQISQKLDGMILEVIYYQKLPPLTVKDNTNWLSEGYPDCYVYGLMTEIGVFTKDVDAISIAEQRFAASISEIDFEDQKDGWSGPPPVVRLM
jgi:hypothetical protein